MAKEEKKEAMTEEEKKKAVAMKNLTAKNLMNVAASYFAYKNKDFGEADNSAMEEFKYFPAFNSGIKAYTPEGEEINVIQDSILSSRENGRYSGNVSEIRIMKSCASVMMESLNALPINDIMSLMGSKAELPEDIGSKYLGSLMQKPSKDASDADKEKMKKSAEIYNAVMGSYQTYLTTKSVSEALSERAKQIPKNLEKMLLGNDEE